MNWPQVNEPASTRRSTKAKQITDPTARAKAWGELDKEVTDQAYFITWLWDKGQHRPRPNVKGVSSKFNAELRLRVQLAEVRVEAID